MKNKKFEEMEFYMHTGSKDICIQIVKIYEQNEDRCKFIARQWNLGYAGRPWRLDMPDLTMIVYKQDKAEWLHIEYDSLINPRFKSGAPV